MYNKQKISWPT